MLAARSLWNSVTDGFSRASRSLDLAGLLVGLERLRRPARRILQAADAHMRLKARSLWNWVTDGFSRARPLKDRAGRLATRAPPPAGPSHAAGG